MSRPNITHWNYRVTVESQSDYDYYCIREVYYEDDKILGWTADGVGPDGETKNELANDLLRMTEAFDKPVIDVTDEDNPKEIL